MRYRQTSKTSIKSLCTRCYTFERGEPCPLEDVQKKGMGKKSFKVFLDAFMESLENDVDILSIGLSNQFIGEDKDLDRAWKKTLTP